MWRRKIEEGLKHTEKRNKGRPKTHREEKQRVEGDLKHREKRNRGRHKTHGEGKLTKR